MKCVFEAHKQTVAASLQVATKLSLLVQARVARGSIRKEGKQTDRQKFCLSVCLPQKWDLSGLTIIIMRSQTRTKLINLSIEYHLCVTFIQYSLLSPTFASKICSVDTYHPLHETREICSFLSQMLTIHLEKWKS